jgi:hypothetical protein
MTPMSQKRDMGHPEILGHPRLWTPTLNAEGAFRMGHPVVLGWGTRLKQRIGDGFCGLF